MATKEGSRATEARAAVEAWITSNGIPIARAMGRFRDELTSTMRQSGEIAPAYSYSFRTISEMPICRSTTKICEKVPPPVDLFPVLGTVTALDSFWPPFDEPNKPQEHMFLTNDDGLIVDFTAAQFVRVEWSAIAEERSRVLNWLAPDLVITHFAGKLTCLIGNAREIEDRLGIRYIAESGQPYD